MALSNCTDRNGILKTTSTIINNSNHKIQLIGFSNNTVNFTSTLNNTEKFSKEEFDDEGGGGIFFTLLDSVFVVFDDSITVLHKNTILGQFPTSNRSLSNHNNYTFIEGNQETHHQYVVTPQDYLDAL
jgi:hypothetical protein